MKQSPVVRSARVWGLGLGLGFVLPSTQAAETVIAFDGSDSYVNIGAPAALQLPSDSPFTIEGWVYFNVVDGSGGRDMLYSKSNGRTTGSGQYTYMFGVYEGGRIAAYNGTGWVEPTPAVTVAAAGEWVHLAYSFNGSALTFYRNGVSVGSADFGYTEKSTQTVKIGGYNTTSDVDGRMSEIRVWDYARSETEIETGMNNRLSGVESGLLGYWPLDEGSGSTVFDASGNGSEGMLVGAGWTTDEDLLLNPADADFAVFSSFTLADRDTGSEAFTNSNAVDVIDFPVPEAYELYQFTLSGETSGIDTNAWISTNTLPETATFPLPPADTNMTLYAWFTRSASASGTLYRASGSIRYTTVAPVPSVMNSYARTLIPGAPVLIYPEQIDTESTGGTTGGEDIPIHSMALQVVSGPGTDGAPNDPWVSLSETGSYGITLVAKNAAGNVATSSVCAVEITAYTGGDFVWSGEDDDDWHNPMNWNLLAVPAAGMDAVIGAGSVVTLSVGTEALHSLSQAGSLTFRGWNTVLVADTITLTGEVSHDAQPATEADEFGEWARDHRVWVQCDTLTVATNAKINVNGKGYQGVPTSAYTAPGRGPGGGQSISGGASYGGLGGRSSDAASVPPPVYGEETAPDHPGSSGARYGSGGLAGHGGGFILIEAVETVTVHGELTANGVTGHSSWGGGSGGGGSGGSIYIVSESVAGDGILSADGGSGIKAWRSGGGGGGGRIAIDYQPAAQSNAAATLAISAAGGMSGTGTSGVSENGRPGTIRLPDTTLLRPLAMQGGEPRIPGFTAWNPERLAVSNGLLLFPTNFLLTVASDIEMPGTAGIELTDGTLSVGGDLAMASTHELAESSFIGGNSHVAGDVLLTGKANLHLTDNRFSADGDFFADNAIVNLTGTWTNTAALSVGRALTFSNAVALNVTCGIAAGDPPPPSVRIAAGSMFVLDDSWVYSQSHPTNGASTVFEIGRRLVVSSNSGFNADYRGFQYGQGPGKGVNGSVSGGAGYGGSGGDGIRISSGAITAGGTEYGDAETPVQPGSGGGYYHGSSSAATRAKGGGLIRIDAGNARLLLDGLLAANGQDVGGSFGGGASGGGSGGGIFINCYALEGNGVLSVRGGRGWNNATYAAGSGGGGRIAVHRVIHDWSGTPTPENDDDRAAGAETTDINWPGTAGNDGTIIWVDVPPRGTMILVR